MNLTVRIKEIIAEQGLTYTEKNRTIYTTCPVCGRNDKFSILKENGSSICYHGSCTFGRKWFDDWLSLTAKISKSDARDRIYWGKRQHTDLELNPKFEQNKAQVIEKVSLTPIDWNINGFLPIDHADAIEGAQYLISRGIPTQLAKMYDIKFSPYYRRIIFPVIMNGKVYGWQGRAIDKVESGFKVRNNEGFKRDSLIMFYDNIQPDGHIIMCEGPIDALKFQLVGGNIATMGKCITKKQIELLNNSGASTLYLGLDQDAANEMRELYKHIKLKLKMLKIPDSCLQRCKESNKKADFGECTFFECRDAFESATNFNPDDILMYIKDTIDFSRL